MVLEPINQLPVGSANIQTCQLPSTAVSRRDFLKLSLATSVALGANSRAWAAEVKGEMPHRMLGSTSEKIARVTGSSP